MKRMPFISAKVLSFFVIALVVLGGAPTPAYASGCVSGHSVEVCSMSLQCPGTQDIKVCWSGSYPASQYMVFCSPQGEEDWTYWFTATC